MTPRAESCPKHMEPIWLWEFLRRFTFRAIRPAAASLKCPLVLCLGKPERTVTIWSSVSVFAVGCSVLSRWGIPIKSPTHLAVCKVSIFRPENVGCASCRLCEMLVKMRIALTDYTSSLPNRMTLTTFKISWLGKGNFAAFAFPMFCDVQLPSMTCFIGTCLPPTLYS